MGVREGREVGERKKTFFGFFFKIFSCLNPSYFYKAFLSLKKKTLCSCIVLCLNLLMQYTEYIRPSFFFFFLVLYGLHVYKKKNCWQFSPLSSSPPSLPSPPQTCCLRNEEHPTEDPRKERKKKVGGVFLSFRR